MDADNPTPQETPIVTYRVQADTPGCSVPLATSTLPTVRVGPAWYAPTSPHTAHPGERGCVDLRCFSASLHELFVSPLGEWTLWRSSRCQLATFGRTFCVAASYVRCCGGFNLSPRTLLYPRQPIRPVTYTQPLGLHLAANPARMPARRTP